MIRVIFLIFHHCILDGRLKETRCDDLTAIGERKINEKIIFVPAFHSIVETKHTLVVIDRFSGWKTSRNVEWSCAGGHFNLWSHCVRYFGLRLDSSINACFMFPVECQTIGWCRKREKYRYTYFAECKSKIKKKKHLSNCVLCTLGVSNWLGKNEWFRLI